MDPNLRKVNRAFTLIEVVIAVGLLGILITVGYGALRNIMISKQLLDDGRDIRLVADAVVGRMTRELQLSFDGISILPPRDNLNQPYSGRVCLLANQSDSIGGVKSDSITFLALEGGQYLPDGGTHSGIVQISYRIVETPPEDAINGSKYSLIREEVPYIRPAKKAYRRSMIFPITDRILGLEFKFLDPRKDEWVTTWGDTNHEDLPRQIWFSVTLQSVGGKVATYATAVPLRGKD